MNASLECPEKGSSGELSSRSSMKRNSPHSKITAAAGFLVWILLVALDLWSKSAAEIRLQNGRIPVIPGVLEFYYLQNTGAAFSLLENAQWLFILIAGIVVLLIGWFLTRVPRSRRYLPLTSSLILISAGAAGNLIDRVRLGYVRDFIYFSLINFPVFNVADIYVTVSTVLLVLLILFYYKEEDFSFLNRRTRI